MEKRTKYVNDIALQVYQHVKEQVRRNDSTAFIYSSSTQTFLSSCTPLLFLFVTAKIIKSFELPSKNQKNN